MNPNSITFVFKDAETFRQVMNNVEQVTQAIANAAKVKPDTVVLQIEDSEVLTVRAKYLLKGSQPIKQA